MIALVTIFSILLLSSFPADAVSESRTAERNTLSESSGDCPGGWLDASFIGMGCLVFNNTASVTWEEANVICKKYSNAALIDIQSEMQMGFLQTELDVIDNALNKTHNWWTAGTDVGREGHWYWATTLEEVGDFVWWNHDTGLDNNCLFLSHYQDYKGLDCPCQFTNYPICQLK